jgi:hypothetical protein
MSVEARLHLSGDTLMMEAYRSGDPYLAFAKVTPIAQWPESWITRGSLAAASKASVVPRLSVADV